MGKSLGAQPRTSTTGRMDAMRIAVIGTGNIGCIIGRACARAGHDVVLGSRKPGGGDVAGGSGATVAGIPEALAGAAVVVLALPGSAVADFARDHADALRGTLVVDATNKGGGDGPANSFDAVTATVPDARYAVGFQHPRL